MCIIYATEGKDSRPTLQELKDGYRRNDDGAGLAYIEGSVVKFRKSRTGYDLESLKRFIDSVDGPMLIHFRFTSSGVTSDKLAHPYPITTDSALINAIQGEADQVFMHNGTLDEREWRQTLLGTDLSKLPRGQWNDSKALAYLLAYYNNDAILNLFDDENRFAVLSPDAGIELYGDWVDVRDGLMTSTYINPPVKWSTNTYHSAWGTGSTTASTGSSATPGKRINDMDDEEFRAYILGKSAASTAADELAQEGFMLDEDDVTPNEYPANYENWPDDAKEAWQRGWEEEVIEQILTMSA